MGSIHQVTDSENSLGRNYKGGLNLKVAGSKYFKARTVNRQSPVLYTVMLQILIIITTIPFSSSLIVLSSIPLIIFLLFRVYTFTPTVSLHLWRASSRLKTSLQVSLYRSCGLPIFLEPSASAPYRSTFTGL